ncbi:hypothetical protein EKO27_g11128 [Xylaria grammica]|uniref:DUF7223 domain-containing protein n=1 Tax=Xylaria grammica TaxID=363999 RepID=A0A439CPA4_9PEZI|nr:hypothetical protein EKO27_g11128 [Xylaria grammica]
MRLQAGFLALVSALPGVTALYDLPDVPLPREIQFADLFETVQSDVLKRSTHDASFSLNFGVANQVLSEGDFHGAKLTVKCVECRTTGEVIASAMLPDISDIDITHPGHIFDTSMLGLTFNGVGATIDLDLSAVATGDFSVPLLKTESPIGVSGPGFQIGVVFSIDLVVKVTGKVETEGGFKVAIPDGSSFIIPFDESKPNIAKFKPAGRHNGRPTPQGPGRRDAAGPRGVRSESARGRVHRAARGEHPGVGVVPVPDVRGARVRGAQHQRGRVRGRRRDLAGVNLGEFNPKASTTLFAASTSTCLKSANATSATKTSSKHASSTTKSKPKPASTSPARHSASQSPARQHSASATPGPSFRPHASASAGPVPTTLATSRKTSPQTNPSHGGSGSGSGGGGSGNSGGNGNNGGFGAPSSFAVAARTYAKRSAYPITLQSLATPITNFAGATPTAAVVDIQPVRP